MYYLVDSSGDIIQSNISNEMPAQEPPPGCRWLPDNFPLDYNPAYTWLRRVQPVPPEATQIEYFEIPRELSEVKDNKKAEIVSEMNKACSSPVAVNGHTFDADNESRNLLTQAIVVAQATGFIPTEWRSSDNVNVSITSIADLVAIAGAMALQVDAAYKKMWDLKSQVDAAANHDTVLSISW